MYTIRLMCSYEDVWITSSDLHHLFSQLTESKELPAKQYKKWFAEIVENPCVTMFAVIESPEKYPKLVGFGTLWSQPKYYRNNGKSGHIEDIVIDKEHRNKGLGKNLVKHIIDYAKNTGCYKVQLHCSKEMQPFYENLSMSHTTQGMSIHLQSPPKKISS